MARIDALYLEDPCSGSRRMVAYLAREEIPISRDRVRNLMRRMGLRAIYQKPRTTVPGDPSMRFPCLVDLREVTAVDQVWATDITYIPLQKGFLYLVAVVDLFSRNVLSWKLSNSLDTEFCLDALEMALEGGRKPEIFHSDQGCQFTSGDFVSRLHAEEIKISWSGRKRCYDNILVERLWRTVKYEEVYLRAYSDGWETEISLSRFLWRYCSCGVRLRSLLASPCHAVVFRVSCRAGLNVVTSWLRRAHLSSLECPSDPSSHGRLFCCPSFLSASLLRMSCSLGSPGYCSCWVFGDLDRLSEYLVFRKAAFQGY